MKLKIKNVRLAFPQLFKPKTFQGDGEPRYGAKFPIAPGSETHKTIEAALIAVAKDEWKAKADTVLAQLRKEGKLFYKHEPHRNKDGEVYDGFEDMFTLSAGQAATKPKPVVLDNVADPATGKARIIPSDQEGKPYGGCYVNATLEVWAQDNKFGRRINCTLVAVQFWKDGDAFAGGAVANLDDFETIEEGADAADMV